MSISHVCKWTDKTYKVPGFNYLIYRKVNNGLIKQVHWRCKRTLPALIRHYKAFQSRFKSLRRKGSGIFLFYWRLNTIHVLFVLEIRKLVAIFQSWITFKYESDKENNEQNSNNVEKRGKQFKNKRERR